MLFPTIYHGLTSRVSVHKLILKSLSATILTEHIILCTHHCDGRSAGVASTITSQESILPLEDRNMMLFAILFDLKVGI